MFYTIELTQNSKLVSYSISESKIHAIDSIIYKLILDKFTALPDSTICIVIKAEYFNQYGEKCVKYAKGGKYYYFKYFTIHANEFSIELLESEMKKRFI